MSKILSRPRGFRVPCYFCDEKDLPDDLKSQKILNPNIFFDNQNPVEIEIGCGKGKFLIALAQEFPQINFLGVDRVAKWMKIGEKRGQKKGLSNLKFVKSEIRELLSHFEKESVSVFHIYFPDPWLKRRHHDRRLINADFSQILWDYLQPQGCVEIATDDADYFLEMKKAIAQQNSWTQVFETVNQRPCHGSIKTNYELKYESAGKPLYYLELKK